MVSVLALRMLNHGCQKYLLCVYRRLHLEMYPGLSKDRAMHEVRLSGHLKLWYRSSLDVSGYDSFLSSAGHQCGSVGSLPAEFMTE